MHGCDGRLIEKKLMTTIQVKFCCLPHISLGLGTELSLLKFLPLASHHSHFIAATLDFTCFSQQGSRGGGGAHFFYSYRLFCLDFTSFCK